MVYIMDHTLGWNKRKARIAYSEFEYGCDTSKGAGLTTKTARHCVQSLIKKSILTVESCKRRGTLYLLNLEWSLDMLRQPRKQRKKKSRLGENVAAEPVNSEETGEVGSSSGLPERAHSTTTSDSTVLPPYINKSKKEVYKENDCEPVGSLRPRKRFRLINVFSKDTVTLQKGHNDPTSRDTVTPPYINKIKK